MLAHLRSIDTTGLTCVSSERRRSDSAAVLETCDGNKATSVAWRVQLEANHGECELALAKWLCFGGVLCDLFLLRCILLNGRAGT